VETFKEQLKDLKGLSIEPVQPVIEDVFIKLMKR